jgi:glycosyltransferase involved in cell wall biosynthesis
MKISDVLIISDDVVGEKMAGPGIRAWEISRSLAGGLDVVLAIPDYSPGEAGRLSGGAPFEVIRYSVASPSRLKEAAGRSRIVLVQGYVLSKFPFLARLDAHLVVDLYDPFVLENLFVHQGMGTALKDRDIIHRHDLAVFNSLIAGGDHFLCASDRQKDLLMGALMALNRINPAALDFSESADELVSIVPFGIREDAGGPRGERVIRGKAGTIGEDDIVLLWGGVISSWFDPLTLISALAQARREDPRLKLYFLSTRHPNPLTPGFEMARRAESAARELGLAGGPVVFNSDWVDYDRRAAYFREADIGVSIHKTHLETRYSFRTRMLDYLKHQLPILCTEGDFFADLVRRENLGIVVGPEDPSELKEAILKLASSADLRNDMRARIARLGSAFSWDTVTLPLAEHCRKVLTGGAAPRNRPTRKEIALVCAPRSPSFLRKIGKKHGWFLFQKLPPALSAKVRRFLK